jgi:hypothetical protein
MRNARKNIVVIGFLIFALMACSGCLFTAESKAQVSFTYTTPVTQKTVALGDTAEFLSTLTNTGSGGDTYDVDMIVKPATPGDWWVRFCTGSVCWPPEVTHAEMSLGPSESDETRLDISPQSAGTGKVIMRITSQTNPSIKDSITFTLNTGSGVPALNQGAMITLMFLLLVSGFYLLWRRLNTAKVK